jgi:hypothetical protein
LGSKSDATLMSQTLMTISLDVIFAPPSASIENVTTYCPANAVSRVNCLHDSEAVGVGQPGCVMPGISDAAYEIILH